MALEVALLPELVAQRTPSKIQNPGASLGMLCHSFPGPNLKYFPSSTGKVPGSPQKLTRAQFIPFPNF